MASRDKPAWNRYDNIWEVRLKRLPDKIVERIMAEIAAKRPWRSSVERLGRGVIYAHYESFIHDVVNMDVVKLPVWKIMLPRLDDPSVGAVYYIVETDSESLAYRATYGYWGSGPWQAALIEACFEKLPFIPLEAEIDQLIAGCSRKVGAFLQLLKETGMKSGEAWRLKWTDLDLANNTIRVTPEKGSEPRIFKISNKLAAMLNNLPRNSERIFGSSSLRTIRRLFQRQRQRLAHKLGNPRLLNITFHTLRHWKATMEYHRTKDILYVMKVLGHRNIKNTLIYTQLVNFPGEDEFICKAARTVEEAKQLIEAGFDYVCDIENVKLFRKRK